MKYRNLFAQSCSALLCLAQAVCAIDPFSPTQLNLFYDNFIYDEQQAVSTAFPQQPSSSAIKPPRGILNYAPLVITNNSGLDASRLYVIGKGQTIAATDAYFLQPNLSTGICTLVSGQTNNSTDPNISVQLSKLPSAGTNSYYIYVPQMISGRFYISVDSPLYMETLFNQNTGYFTINDPSQTTIQDPNYYTLYQDFEFTLDSKYDLYANVTNVDYFSLPLTLGSYTFPTGNLYPTLDNLTVVGYPTTSARSTILTSIQTGLANDQSSPAQWAHLTIPFYNNPYAAGPPDTDLRILAAKLSIALGISSDPATGIPFRGAANPQGYFNAMYLQSTTSGPAAMTSYMTKLYDYYNTPPNQLELTISPAKHPQVSYIMTASATSGILHLELQGTSPAAPPIITVNLNNLSTSSLLSGAVGDWVAENAITPAATNPWQTEIAKMLSALFTAGMLPPASSVVQPVIDDSTYFSAYRGSYFSNPTGFSLHGPWFNLYDQTIHPLLIQTNNFGLGYAYDFDDLLDLAGLLHVNIQTDGTLNPEQPYCVLTLGPIDTTIPEATQSFGPYSLQVNNINASSNPIDVIYSTVSGQAPSTVYSVPDSGALPTFSGVYDYFIVRYYTSAAKTTSFSYNVYPKYQLVLPTTTRYNAEDVTLMNGIVFQAGTDGSTFIISLPNTNPFP